MNFDIKDEGMISQWNEGNLKSLRLHEAQELINNSKIDPLKKNVGDKWNYEIWIFGITILYGEGQSKYSNDEIKDIEEIKELIYLRLAFNPITKTTSSADMFNSSRKTFVNYKNWENLRKLIELYEQKVRLFNDKHGLSTRNYDDDWEGL